MTILVTCEQSCSRSSGQLEFLRLYRSSACIIGVFILVVVFFFGLGYFKTSIWSAASKRQGVGGSDQTGMYKHPTGTSCKCTRLK